MNRGDSKTFNGCFAVGVTTLLILSSPAAFAQGQNAQSPKAIAPVDFTGYWVSVVNEDWRYRMLLPLKGDYAGVPMNAAARKVAEAWDPAKDEAAGEQCRSYGAPNLLRVPGRLHITWQDDSTLRLEADAGSQTRVFRFGKNPPPDAPPSWQGQSVASWELGGESRGRGSQNTGGALKVATTHLRPGYLRINGVPYSETALLTEYYNVIRDTRNTRWLIVTTIVEDPVYLTDRYTVSNNFKEQSDSQGWDPTACAAR